MAAKDVRNLIISLVLLEIGIFVIQKIAKGYTSNPAFESIAAIESSFESLITLFMIGVGILILVLIPVYLSKRSSEKTV